MALQNVRDCNHAERVSEKNYLGAGLGGGGLFDLRSLMAVLQTCRQVEASGGEFRLCCPSGAVLAVLDLTGAGADLPIAA